jgi:hypothetical protein
MTEKEILKEFADLEKEDFQGMYEFFARTPEKSPLWKLLVDGSGSRRACRSIAALEAKRAFFGS